MNAASIVALITALGPALQIFGGVLPALQQVFSGIFGTGIPTVANNNATRLLQQGLNAIQASGKAQFEGVRGQPNSPLLVDGGFGGRTFAAVKAVQSAFGWNVQEPLASIEMQLLATLLAKLG